jgi:formylglycine-generating enzyme required for sulfatase activity
MSRQVFISHASANAELARRICGGLESRELPCWIAPRDIRFEGTYGPEIAKGLHECRIFLIIVSEAAEGSEHVEREAAMAADAGKRIIPVIVDPSASGSRLSYYLAGRQQFPCRSGADDAFLDGLAAAIQGRPGAHATEPRAAKPGRQSGRWRPAMLLAAIATVAIAASSLIAYFYFAAPSRQFETNPTERPAAGGPSTKSEGSPPPQSGPPATASAPTTTTPATDGNQVAVVPPRRVTSTPAAPAVPAPPTDSTLVNGARLRYVPIPAGEFVMGCSPGDNECEDDEKALRRETVSSFMMSATEVTQAFWEAAMGSNPSDFKGPAQPVEHVSWRDAQDFISNLNDRNDGFVYRLPSEKEWEYAARASATIGPDLKTVAWFGLAESSAIPSRPQPVAKKAANRWGLYDVLGNVAEWCDDWYTPNERRVVRGGSWVDGPRSLRFSARGSATPTTRDYAIGLRLVRQAK